MTNFHSNNHQGWVCSHFISLNISHSENLHSGRTIEYLYAGLNEATHKNFNNSCNNVPALHFCNEKMENRHIVHIINMQASRAGSVIAMSKQTVKKVKFAEKHEWYDVNSVHLHVSLTLKTP